MDYNKIAEEIKKKRFTLKSVAESTGLTYSGLVKSFNNKTLKVKDLEKISGKLNIPMSFWWDEGNLNVVNDFQGKYYNKLEDENAGLKEQIKQLNEDKACMRRDFDLILKNNGISKVGT